MTIDEASSELRVAKGTMYQWRHRGEGPPSLKVGGRLRYRREDVQSFIDEQVKLDEEEAETELRQLLGVESADDLEGILEAIRKLPKERQQSAYLGAALARTGVTRKHPWIRQWIKAGCL